MSDASNRIKNNAVGSLLHWNAGVGVKKTWWLVLAVVIGTLPYAYRHCVDWLDRKVNREEAVTQAVNGGSLSTPAGFIATCGKPDSIVSPRVLRYRDMLVTFDGKGVNFSLLKPAMNLDQNQGMAQIPCTPTVEKGFASRLNQ